MESVVNFTRAFESVFDEMKAAGRVNDRDGKMLAGMLTHPARTTKHGLRVNRMNRSHRRVRWLYLREHGLPFGTTLDWNTLIQWIKDNWVEIVKAILFILFLFI